MVIIEHKQEPEQIGILTKDVNDGSNHLWIVTVSRWRNFKLNWLRFKKNATPSNNLFSFLLPNYEPRINFARKRNVQYTKSMVVNVSSTKNQLSLVEFSLEALEYDKLISREDLSSIRSRVWISMTLTKSILKANKFCDFVWHMHTFKKGKTFSAFVYLSNSLTILSWFFFSEYLVSFNDVRHVVKLHSQIVKH